MPFVSNGDTRIYYEHWRYPRTKRVTTLINGYGRPSSDFRKLGKALVQAGCAVVTLDNRTVGRTQSTRPFTLAEMCSDIIAVWDYLEIKYSALLGISMGGAIAQMLALTYPQKVTRLVLISSFADNSFALTQNRRRWHSEEALRAALTDYVAPTFYHSNRALLAAMAKQMWQKLQSRTTDADWQREALSNFSTRERLAQIECPVLVLHGMEDRIISPQAAQVLHHSLRNSKLQLLPDTGHMLLIEKPAELRTVVVAFCAD